MHQVPAVHQPNRDSDIPWPLSMRWPLAVWNWVFHDDKVYTPDDKQSAQWNRGAYLVQGLEHCGTCHTPSGIAFQEKALDQSDSAYLTGGTLEGWHAPDLTANAKQGLGRWTEDDIAQFLKTGRTDSSAAFGSMTDVVEHSTQYLTDDDLKAMAVYLHSLKASDNKAAPPQADNATVLALTQGDMRKPGAQEYMDNCAACHRIDGEGYAKTFPALAHNPALLSDDPSSLVSIVLRGGKMAVTKDAVTGLTMPDFAWRLNDRQVPTSSALSAAVGAIRRRRSKPIRLKRCVKTFPPLNAKSPTKPTNPIPTGPKPLSNDSVMANRPCLSRRTPHGPGRSVLSQGRRPGIASLRAMPRFPSPDGEINNPSSLYLTNARRYSDCLQHKFPPGTRVRSTVRRQRQRWHLYLIRMDHPQGEGWDRYVVEHVRYLKTLIEKGALLASGPLMDTPLRAGFLIMAADSRQQVEALIAADPFSREGLICQLRIEKWDPLFGCLAEQSSQTLPPALAALMG